MMLESNSISSILFQETIDKALEFSSNCLP